MKGFLIVLIAIPVCLFCTSSCGLSMNNEPLARGLTSYNAIEVVYDGSTCYCLDDLTGVWRFDKAKMEYVGVTDPYGFCNYVWIFRNKGGAVSAVLLERYRGKVQHMYYNCMISWYDFLTAEFSSGTVCGGNGSSIYDFDCKRLEEIADVSACLPVSDTFIPHESGLELRLILKDADCISCVFPILESDGSWFIGVKERYYLLIENEELTAALSQRQIELSR